MSSGSLRLQIGFSNRIASNAIETASAEFVYRLGRKLNTLQRRVQLPHLVSLITPLPCFPLMALQAGEGRVAEDSFCAVRG